MNDSGQSATVQTNAELAQRWSDSLMNTYGAPPVALVSGRGAWVTDAEGKDYLDLLAGIAVNSLGYAHPQLVDAVSRQVAAIAHSSNLFGTSPVVAVAEELKKRVGDDSARVFFSNSGAEANEAAVKLARLTGRRRILAAHRGFHGRTLGSLAVTGQPAKRAPFEPLPAGVEFYPFGDIDYLRSLVEMNSRETAAIFVEPIQGETGVVPAPQGFLAHMRQLCDEHGILMVVDEVQAGAGRAGTFFAHQADRVRPDVITMAKGLGGGLPIGVTIACGAAAELFEPGSHGTTFGGNPVACSAATAVLEVLDEEFFAEVRRKGERLRAELEQLDEVDHVRGRGLMLGVVLRRPVAKTAVRTGLEHGLILNAPRDSVVRLTPPLVITDDDIDCAIERLRDVLGRAHG